MKLSICCITYNHKKFVAQAIESFLQQEKYLIKEIVIHDDASTDGTQDVIKSYVSRFPTIVRATFHTTNIGMMANFFGAIADCRGEYISFCEGDDFWVDNKKLLKQIKILDERKDLVICWTSGYTLDQFSQKLDALPSDEIDVSFDRLLEGNKFLLATAVFRNQYWTTIDKWLLDSPYGDYLLYIKLFYETGKIGLKISDRTAVYRRHENSSHSSLHNTNSGKIKVYDDHLIFQKLINKRFLNKKQKSIFSNYLNELAEYLGIDRNGYGRQDFVPASWLKRLFS